MQFRNLFLLAYGVLAVQARAIPQMTKVNETTAIFISQSSNVEARAMRKSLIAKLTICVFVNCLPAFTEIPHHIAVNKEKKKLAEQKKKEEEEEEVRKSVEHDYSAYYPTNYECLPQSVKQADSTFVTVPCKRAEKAVARVEKRRMRKSFLGKAIVCALVAQCAPMLTEIPHHTAIHREEKKLAEQKKKAEEEEVRKSVEHSYSAYSHANDECLPQSVRQADGTFVTVPCNKNKKAVVKLEKREIRKSLLGKALVCALALECDPLYTEIPYHRKMKKEKKLLAEQKKKDEEEEVRKSVEHDYDAYDPTHYECLPQSVKQADGTFVTVPCKKTVATLEKRDMHESANINPAKLHQAHQNVVESQEHANGTTSIELHGGINDHGESGNAATGTTTAMATIEARGLRRSKKIKAILCGIFYVSCISLATEVRQDTKERIAQEHEKEREKARKEALEFKGNDFRIYDAANYKCLPKLVKQEDGTSKVVPCDGQAAAAAAAP